MSYTADQTAAPSQQSHDELKRQLEDAHEEIDALARRVKTLSRACEEAEHELANARADADRYRRGYKAATAPTLTQAVLAAVDPLTEPIAGSKIISEK